MKGEIFVINKYYVYLGNIVLPPSYYIQLNKNNLNIN